MSAEHEVADYIQIDSVAGNYSTPATVQFLRGAFIPAAQKVVDPSQFSKKVFVSRKKAFRRKISNEDEIFALFKPHGFVRYNLEDLSVLEQVTLFHHAEIIVAEHGAALANLVLSQCSY